MKYLHTLLLPLTAVGMLMFPAMTPAASLEPIDSSGVQVQSQEQNGITYLSGGIGEDESKAIQQTTGYNLHIHFPAGIKNPESCDSGFLGTLVSETTLYQAIRSVVCKLLTPTN